MSLACLSPVTWAQLPDEAREQLARAGVVISGGYVYASAIGPLRGTLETSEDLYATRAMRALAASMCDFEPSPGRSLEAGISGFTIASTALRGREVEVVMRAPVQKPVCRVTTVPLLAPVASATPAPSNLELPAPEAAAAEAKTRLPGQGFIRSIDITVRVFGSEY